MAHIEAFERPNCDFIAQRATKASHRESVVICEARKPNMPCKGQAHKIISPADVRGLESPLISII